MTKLTETGVQGRGSVAVQVMAMAIFPVDDESLKDAALLPGCFGAAQGKSLLCEKSVQLQPLRS